MKPGESAVQRRQGGHRGGGSNQPTNKERHEAACHILILANVFSAGAAVGIPHFLMRSLLLNSFGSESPDSLVCPGSLLNSHFRSDD